MTRAQDHHRTKRTTLVFAFLTLGLVVAIYALRTVPAQNQLEIQRKKRRALATSHEKISRQLHWLDTQSATLGTDPFATERFMRQQNYGRPLEFKVIDGESGR